MTEQDKKIIRILEVALENGDYVRLYQLATLLERRASNEQKLAEIVRDYAH